MAFPKVRVNGAADTTTIEIDGVDISGQVKTARIDIGERGRVPVVWLETMSGDLVFDGEAQINVVSLGSPAAEFLGNIDPGLLDRAVNDLLQIQGGSYAELALTVLRTWAEGGG